MPSAHPAMDGGKNYPQHEHQQSGNTLYSIPGLCSQLAVPAMEVRARVRLPGRCHPQGLSRVLQPVSSWSLHTCSPTCLPAFPGSWPGVQVSIGSAGGVR